MCLVELGAQDMGQGVWTALAQIAADSLGLELERLEFRAGVTLRLMVRPVCPQLRKFPVCPGGYAWCQESTFTEPPNRPSRVFTPRKQDVTFRQQHPPGQLELSDFHHWRFRSEDNLLSFRALRGEDPSSAARCGA
jgi:Molybdopterin-binding domain of aldehyde dehydrogenase